MYISHETPLDAEIIELQVLKYRNNLVQYEDSILFNTSKANEATDGRNIEILY